MKTIQYLQLILATGAMAVLAGCSDVKFKSELPNCVGNSSIDSTRGNRCTLKDSFTTGRADILFVVDNSGSMSTEQKKLRDNFANLMAVLDDQGIDYNIAITTTDIETLENPKSELNENGALQNGNFIPFPNGKKILEKKSTSQERRQQYFEETIVRKETIECESDFRNCPSNDERAIYALNLVVQRADEEFFRDNSLFAAVILSDEDERSDGSNANPRPFDQLDYPETLVSNLATHLGNKKQMVVNSIIVEPDDYQCKNEQDTQIANNSHIKGFFGNYYAELSNPNAELMSLGNILPGETASICAESIPGDIPRAGNFAEVLSNIADKIATESLVIPLPCKPEEQAIADKEKFTPLKVSVTLATGEFFSNPPYHLDENNRVLFDEVYPAGSRVNYEVVCARYED